MKKTTKKFIEINQNNETINSTELITPTIKLMKKFNGISFDIFVGSESCFVEIKNIDVFKTETKKRFSFDTVDNLYYIEIGELLVYEFDYKFKKVI